MSRTSLLRDLKFEISRRQFLKGAGVLALSTLLPKPTFAATKNRRIVIVGGGIAGLNCALTLADHGIKSEIYEASPRLGGRMFSNPNYWNENQVSEWCGELIDTGHETIHKLAKRFHLHLDSLLTTQPKKSKDTFFFNGKYYPKSQFEMDFKPVYTVIVQELKACDYPTTYNKSTPMAKTLDHLSLYDWIETRIPGGHQSNLGQLIGTAYTIEYGADTKEQSSLNFIYLIASQPKKNEVGIFGESDEAFHIRGGNDQLPKAIAKHLGSDIFRMGQKLVSLEKKLNGSYELVFTNSQSEKTRVEPDAVVLALPFSALKNVDLTLAGFDELKLKAIHELGGSKSAKTQLQFSERIWNKKGEWPHLSTGTTFSDTGYQASWEVTRAQAGKAGILNFFSGGSVVTQMKSSQPFTSSNNAAAVEDAKTVLSFGEKVLPGLTQSWNEKLTQSIPHLHPLMGASYPFYKPGQYATIAGYEAVKQGQV